jgi:hypothetical protein
MLLMVLTIEGAQIMANNNFGNGQQEISFNIINNCVAKEMMNKRLH